MKGLAVKVAADRKCFICGPENRIGLKVDFRIDEQNNQAEARISLSELYQGWQGVVHGGIISALLDEAAIYACRPVSMHGVTAGLNVRFRQPVPTDTEVYVIAEVVSIKRKIASVSARLLCDKEVMAEAEVKVKLLDEIGENLS